MCKCLPKRQVKTIGLLSTLFYGILSISCIIIQGFDFQQLDMPWTDNGPWRFTAVLQVSSVVFVFLFFIMGITVFAAGECKTIQIIYIVLGGASTMFSFCISVFTLTAAAINSNELTLNCQQNYTGVFQYFRALDNYFHLVDQNFCTKDCPCLLTNITAIKDFKDEVGDSNDFKDNVVVYDEKDGGVVNFGQCPYKVTLAIHFLFNSNKDNLNNVGELKDEEFFIYWKKIEEQFKCVGWCSTSYRKPGESKDISMIKYLFSDINGGVVRNRGCMKQLVNWLPKMLNIFGSFMLLISIGQGASAGFAFSLFTDMVLEGSNYPDMNDFPEKGSNKTQIKIDGYIGGNIDKTEIKTQVNIDGSIGGDENKTEN